MTARCALGSDQLRHQTAPPHTHTHKAFSWEGWGGVAGARRGDSCGLRARAAPPSMSHECASVTLPPSPLQ